MSQLKLYAGVDIPFPEARLSVHQPTIREIAWVGEQKFFTGIEFLNFNKDKFLDDEDKVRSINQSNFDIFIAMLRNTHPTMKRYRNCAGLVLTLLFPDFEIHFEEQGIMLQKDEFCTSINNDNFEKFKFILKKICVLTATSSEEEYNPLGERAAQIAKKLKSGREKANAAKGVSARAGSTLGKIVSLLSIGQNIPVTVLLDYTLIELYDAYNRFNLKNSFDLYVSQKLAGAKDVKEVEEWTGDIDLEHPKQK